MGILDTAIKFVLFFVFDRSWTVLARRVRRVRGVRIARPPMTDTNVTRYVALPTPAELIAAHPNYNPRTVMSSRSTIRTIMHGDDPRRIVVVGPCSIHDVDGALEYGTRLEELQRIVASTLFLVMRVYIQKPRTRGGWTGFLDDPTLDGSFQTAMGIRESRMLMLKLTELGLPICTEFLGTTIEPQYFADLVSLGMVGARTCESQLHRHLVSGLSMPCVFKNTSDGSIAKAVDACVCASKPRSFIGIDRAGRPSQIRTSGNDTLGVVLRGSYTMGPNDQKVDAARAALIAEGLTPAVIVDCAHGNSHKTLEGTRTVLQRLLPSAVGIMLESYLMPGRGSGPHVSITDPCLGWTETEREILALHASFGQRTTVL